MAEGKTGISSTLAMQVPQPCAKPDGLTKDCGVSTVLEMNISQFLVQFYMHFFKKNILFCLTFRYDMFLKI